jgi:sulfide:quinone oxidoreductase
VLGRRSSLARKSVPEPGAAALEVVIAGGGVAALETALALHELAGDRVNLTLLAPTADFIYRPVAVLEPFVRVPPGRLALARVAAEVNATLEHDSVAAVDCDRRVLRTGGQRELRYDALVVAVGARTCEVLPGVVAMDVSRMDESLRGLIEEIDSGSLRSLAFVVPRPTWPLPAYEVALLAQRHAREQDIDLDITIVTAEQQPLAVFGETVSAGVARLLADVGLHLMIGACVESSTGKLIASPGACELRFDRVVAIPRLAGPAITGLPADADGFLPVNSYGAVTGVERVYAAGDATDFPVKFGGMAARLADAAATSIASAAGAPTEPRPFDGIVHGVLLTGGKQGILYFTTRIEGGLAVDSWLSETSKNPTWSPEAKIDARYLGPYLDELWAGGPPWRLAARAGYSMTTNATPP